MFEQESATVVIVSSQAGRAKGTDGTQVETELLLGQLHVNEFDAVIFIGGPGVQEYWNNALAHSLAREAVKRNKVLGAICWAPVVLANAGVLEGKEATVYNQGPEAKLLQEKGARYTGDAVTVDGTIVTANGPVAAGAFAEAVVDLLKK
jgi:protease I